jgi:hypothetical protein
LVPDTYAPEYAVVLQANTGVYTAYTLDDIHAMYTLSDDREECKPIVAKLPSSRCSDPIVGCEPITADDPLIVDTDAIYQTYYDE